MFNLSHASKSLLDKNYCNAIKLYEMVMEEIDLQKVSNSYVVCSVCVHLCASLCTCLHAFN